MPLIALQSHGNLLRTFRTTRRHGRWRVSRSAISHAGDVHPSQLPWDRVDTVAVLGGGPMWDEPPFYRVFDAVLDNEGDAVFLVNGGDGELIRYDIGSGRTSRIGRGGSGPGEFGRPVWLEPHGPDSLLAYDMSLGRFSVFSRSGDFGRIFMGIGGCVDPAGKAYLPRDGPDSGPVAGQGGVSAFRRVGPGDGGGWAGGRVICLFPSFDSNAVAIESPVDDKWRTLATTALPPRAAVRPTLTPRSSDNPALATAGREQVSPGVPPEGSTTVPSNRSWAMITKPRIAHTLVPSLMLAASVAFPVGAGAQTAPPSTKSAPLSAAMAEARRSPFYTTSNVEGLTTVELALFPGPHVGDRPDPDSAQAPSFHRVFWPTLGAVFLSDVAFIYGILHCSSDSGAGTSDVGCAGGLLLGTTTLVVGPPAVASIMGARFTQGLLGSAAGVGLGYGLFRLGIAVGLDDSSAYWAIPTTHAFLTTVISRS